MGKYEEAITEACLILNSEEKMSIMMSIALNHMQYKDYIKSIEVLTSMGRLVDVILLLLYIDKIELAGMLSIILIIPLM